MAAFSGPLNSRAAKHVDDVRLLEWIFVVEDLPEREGELPSTDGDEEQNEEDAEPLLQTRTNPGPVKNNNQGREGKCNVLSTFNQPYVTCSRALGGLFVSEFDPLPLAEQLEHSASHRTTVEEVFDAGFITNESEPFIDQQSCDRARRHTLLR